MIIFDIHISLEKRVSNRKGLRESGVEPTPIQDFSIKKSSFEQEVNQRGVNPRFQETMEQRDCALYQSATPSPTLIMNKKQTISYST